MYVIYRKRRLLFLLASSRFGRSFGLFCHSTRAHESKPSLISPFLSPKDSEMTSRA
jgi:hypothetical protein